MNRWNIECLLFFLLSCDMKINCLRKEKEKIIFEDVDNLMLLYCIYDVVFIFPFILRVTLPCAPHLINYAETNGGKQKSN